MKFHAFTRFSIEIMYPNCYFTLGNTQAIARQNLPRRDSGLEMWVARSESIERALGGLDRTNVYSRFKALDPYLTDSIANSRGIEKEKLLLHYSRLQFCKKFPLETGLYSR